MDLLSMSNLEQNAASTPASRFLQTRNTDEYPTIETSEVSLAGEILEAIFSIGYEVVSQEKKQPSAFKFALKLRNELDMMRTWADDLHLVDGALQRVLQDSRELREPLYRILGEFLSLLLSYPKVTIKSKCTLQTLQDKISWTFPEVDDDHEPELESNSQTQANSDGDTEESLSESESEMDSEEFIDEFKESSEVFRFLACNIADEMERTSNQISQEPPKVIPTLTNMPEYQFRINIQDKLPHAKLHIVERLAAESWRLYQSVVYGLQRQRNLEMQSAMLKSSMTVSATDEGYKTASSQVTKMTPSLIDGLPQKAVVPMQDIAQYAISIASSAPVNTSDRPKLPRLPPGAGFGTPFICHICATLQSSINTLQDWKKHIYTDLQPYLCTFKNCPLKKIGYTIRFSNRQHWWQHEMSHHRLKKSYKCTLTGCGAVRVSKDQFVNHVRADHPRLRLKDGSFIISECSKEQWDLDTTLMYCPFCDDCKGERKSKLSQHIAHHFEDQALIVLGIAGGFREEEDSKGDSDEDSKGDSDEDSKGDSDEDSKEDSEENTKEDSEEEGNDPENNQSLSDVVSPGDVTGLSKGATKDLGKESSLTPDGQQNDEINCICGFSDDDGFIIQCDHCERWQHAVCVGVTEDDIPDDWICHMCEPTKFSISDMKRAYNIQKFRMEHTQLGSGSLKDTKKNFSSTHFRPLGPGQYYRTESSLRDTLPRPPLPGMVIQFDEYITEDPPRDQDKN